MLDLRYVRENFDKVKERLATRGGDLPPLNKFAELEGRRRQLLMEVEELKHRRNTASELIGKMKKEGRDATAEIAEMKEVSNRIKEMDVVLGGVEEELSALMMVIPNLPHDSTTVGKDAGDNPEVRTFGKKPEFAFKPQAHWDLGEKLGILDFTRGAKIAGARFTLYRGTGAALERALINFMLDLHTREHGYTEFLPPFMVNRASMTGTGQLPKFEAELFKLDDWDFFLIPTAEVPVTNIHAGETLREEDLPLYYTAYTPCFRKEAGAAGKDTRGLIRQHQFNKVEMVKFTTPETSYAELEKLTDNAEEILRRLGIHYRVISLCTGDLGFSSAKTYDIEAWMPGQGVYREISSCSNFEDFQARRAGIRYRPKDKKKSEFVHTLNGSGLAIGRTLVAILENYQEADGGVIVPPVLRPYMHGLEKITPA